MRVATEPNGSRCQASGKTVLISMGTTPENSKLAFAEKEMM